MQIIGVDTGRYKTKVWHGGGHFEFYSNLGEYRESEFEDEVGTDDLVINYKNNILSGGTLALRESEYGETMMTDSKLHDDTLVNILTGVHKTYNSGDVGLVTNLPVKDHARDKSLLAELISGYHEITLNRVTKWFHLYCAVGPEGSTFYKYARPGKTIRGLQIGSRTVNAITFRDGIKIGKESDTFDFGTESGKSKDPIAMARATIAKTGSLKWKRDDEVYLAGGGSFDTFEPIKRYYHRSILDSDPVFADSKAYYDIAREVFYG